MAGMLCIGERGRRAIACLEQYAEGLASKQQLAAAHQAAGDSAAREAERAVRFRLLRDLFGNPFRAQPSIDPRWLAWNNGVILNLTQTLYAERSLPEGTLDRTRLGILADALEEAGCADAT